MNWENISSQFKLAQGYIGESSKNPQQAIKSLSNDFSKMVQSESFKQSIEGIANYTPAIGHIKGLYHYGKGQIEKGNEAMLSSTRTSAVIGFGMMGGAYIGVVGGLMYDGTVTGISSANAKKYTPYGLIEPLTKIYTEKGGVDNFVEAGTGIAMDAGTAYVATIVLPTVKIPSSISKEVLQDNAKSYITKTAKGYANQCIQYTRTKTEKYIWNAAFVPIIDNICHRLTKKEEVPKTTSINTNTNNTNNNNNNNNNMINNETIANLNPSTIIVDTIEQSTN
ncbi:hypothetical protein DFA_03424 [Cavenderia fasciculata]|uniref:Uncharacterized protein n=1 Tax=Cavenderia fasciculata TaxID=261658 RepID=F4PHJ2_CACFS|nr:uncharacterized protein DFA_03424 [Cavenderia fasciculata]EGG25176.1 hypothetical protein DFA_03424 [Cavenderia fasciculata]|eukprot:XP_004363027.1 hypothetical protein DFA_03424 [Cavenderia fasciculata]